MGSVVAIVLGAGAGERLGIGDAKAFVDIGGRSMLALACASAAASSSVGSLVVAAPPDRIDDAHRALSDLPVPAEVVAGGATRQSSVRAALAAVPDDAEIVVVHDAARPFASPVLFDAVVGAVRSGAVGAIPIVPLADTVKRLDGDRVVATVDRSGLGLAQTPQAFRASALRGAHADALDEGATDDAMLLETGGGIHAVDGDPGNRKITTPDDLTWARERGVTTDG